MMNLCQNNLPFDKSYVSEVKNKIAMCIQKYMNLEEIVTNLQNNHMIDHRITRSIWRNLEEENKDFFNIYRTRCLVIDQIKTFNDLLAKHVAMANLSSNSIPRHTEGTLVLESPNHQQNQILHGQISQYNDPIFDKRYYYPRAPNVAVANTDQRSTDNNLAYIEAPSTSLAATIPQESHALESTSLFGCKDIDELAKLLESDEEQEDTTGQFQLHSQWQQNFSTTTENQALDYGGNLLQDREVNAQQKTCHNIEQNQAHSQWQHNFSTVQNQALVQGENLLQDREISGQQQISHNFEGNQDLSHLEEHGLRRTTELPRASQYWTPELNVFEESSEWWLSCTNNGLKPV